MILPAHGLCEPAKVTGPDCQGRDGRRRSWSKEVRCRHGPRAEPPEDLELTRPVSSLRVDCATTTRTFSGAEANVNGRWS